ncbi:MAG TPA: hypothetical protein VMV82_09795 [Candidatus Dormibacteraeota bacterium]|nr:hypothetical protein [Candidatus Dormibacteraeota bacterium]
MKRAIIPFGAAALLVAMLAGGGFPVPSVGATAPPSPPPLVDTSPAPSPSATPTEIPGVQSLFPSSGHGPHASPSPPPPQRVGIEGVWELAIQRGGNTTYTHLKLHQQQNALTGIYIDSSNKRAPAVGIVNGNSVRVVVTLPNGSTIVFQGTLDGTTDMIGMMTTPTEQLPFSADYRPKENFFDNINEQPGGLANPFPSPPPK